MQEPKDGDFVAYVEALQRESAARLARGQTGAGAAAFPHRAPAASAASEAVPTAAPAPAKITASPDRHDRGRLVRAILAAVVGAMLLLSWLGDGGPFAFIIGIALLVYALPRVVAALGALNAVPTNKAMIEHVFGRSGTSSKGTGK